MGSALWKLDNRARKREKRAGPLGALEIWMANRAIWSMRLRHEWLKSPLKKARFKRSQRIRVGYEDALQRRGVVGGDPGKSTK